MLLYFILGICLALTSAVGDINAVQQRIEEESYYPNINFSDAFDWKLLKEFSFKYRNVLLSPISIKLILALLYQGSSGSTEREFQNVLQYATKKSVNDVYSQILSTLQASERSEYLLNMGTCIFLDSQIPANPKFQVKASRYYRTEIQPTPFSNSPNASRTINSWVEKITNGKVSQMVNPGDLRQTAMLIANAVYFKGTWRHPFPKNQTHIGKFVVSSEDMKNVKTVNVDYMSTTDTFFMQESQELDSKILRLPYKGSDYSMFIILPNSLGGLPNLLRRINLNNLSLLLYSLEKRLVEVNIPKFKFNFKAKMGEALQNFGLHQMFQNTASFTGITKGNNSIPRMLVVSDIIQKSGIELDEEGSVVYSATDVNIGNKFGEPREVFNATHPFLFFVEGPNGSILFNGKVENPLEEDAVAVPPRSAEKEGYGPEVQIGAQAVSRPQSFVTNNKNTVPSTTIFQNYPQGQNVPNLQPNVPNQATNLDSSSFELQPSDKEELIYRFNLFDIELLNEFADSKINVFISPASIKTTLAMILEGAKGNCAVEISEALRIPNIHQKGVREILMGLLKSLKETSSTTYLENSNAVFASDKYRVLESYRKTINQFYGGAVKSVNFKNTIDAVATINNWVTDATHGAIREIVGAQSLSPESSAVIANALYFKGKWKTSFDSQNTKPKCFHAPSGCVLTSMMRVSANFKYSYISRLRTHAVEIPYESKFSMLILLPSEEANIRSVIRDLPHFKLGDILNKLKPADIILEMPKFKFDYSADLVEYLKLLRIRDIFGAKANLSGIVENGNVVVNSLMHKTRIEVDEQGTVAAAATGAIVIPLMGSTAVVADRPFVFCIYHQQSENIIFEGILLNPQEENDNLDVNTPARSINDFRLRSRQFS